MLLHDFLLLHAGRNFCLVIFSAVGRDVVCMSLQTLEKKVHLCFRPCVKAAYAVWGQEVAILNSFENSVHSNFCLCIDKSWNGDLDFTKIIKKYFTSFIVHLFLMSQLTFRSIWIISKFGGNVLDLIPPGFHMYQFEGS